MLRSEKGFTLVELIIVIIVVAIIVVFAILFINGILKGNQWYTEDGVLKSIQFEHPEVTEILKTERNIFDKSVIYVKEGGINRVYLLDSNILFNYKIEE